MQIDLQSYINIVQIGCGGTGGYLVPKLARLIMTLKQFKKVSVSYNLADPDMIEEANLYRQNFVQPDKGKNKAHTMAQRYGRHFGIDIGSSNAKIETGEQIINLFQTPKNDGVYWSPKQTCILIGCVDNNSARQVMHQAFHEWNGFNFGHSLTFLDVGNGKYTGQLVTGHREADRIILSPVGDIFPDSLVVDENEVSVSCTMNALENPQNVGANDLAATLVFSVMNILLTEGEINSHILTFNGRTQEFLNRTKL
jgi:PRTRC genetic system ThiF family protein